MLAFLQCKNNQSKEKQHQYISENSVTSFPESLGYVSDYENTLTSAEIQNLNTILSEYDKTTTNKIAIVSINKNLNENNFDQYALDLSNHWGIGDPGKNNGLTIVYSSKLRKIKISTGKGVENILTDEICEQVMNEKILPKFKKGDYFLGIKNGIAEFIKIWK
ncbi:TPM domain-containing protein [Chryseobacterium sp.]|uniref:TPM domain-containing protein n=1 Tax=Chryseobacterium sp. TaxID=1871047 RepID=UPI0025C390CB|nr:TPM domain-containing protein [Chryseobacterium sp.]